MNISNIIKELKKIIPAENFRRQPDWSIKEVKKLEKKYNLNTSDFLVKNFDFTVEEEDILTWLNEFEHILMFDGNEDMVNSISTKKE